MNVWGMQPYHPSHPLVESENRRSHTRNPPLIVLFEPDQAIAHLMSDVLVSQGYRVFAAPLGSSMDSCASLNPQAVIVGVGPRVKRSFRRVLHDVRATLNSDTIPVLLTTTSTRIDRATALYLEQQSCEVLFLPFELEVLLDWVARWLPLCGDATATEVG